MYKDDYALFVTMKAYGKCLKKENSMNSTCKKKKKVVTPSLKAIQKVTMTSQEFPGDLFSR